MKDAITHERLLHLLQYDPETGWFTWRVRRNQHADVGDRAGYLSLQNGYRYMNIGGRLYLAHRLAVFYMTGEWPASDVDHQKGDRDDNRWERLRQLTRQHNAQNLQRAHCDNKSGFLGVAPMNGRHAAYIRIDGKNRYLGTYDTPEEAHDAYVAAKRQHHEGNTL
jgi:hypothetical protein